MKKEGKKDKHAHKAICPLTAVMQSKHCLNGYLATGKHELHDNQLKSEVVSEAEQVINFLMNDFKAKIKKKTFTTRPE